MPSEGRSAVVVEAAAGHRALLAALSRLLVGPYGRHCATDEKQGSCRQGDATEEVALSQRDGSQRHIACEHPCTLDEHDEAKQDCARSRVEQTTSLTSTRTHPGPLPSMLTNQIIAPGLVRGEPRYASCCFRRMDRSAPPVFACQFGGRLSAVIVRWS